MNDALGGQNQEMGKGEREFCNSTQCVWLMKIAVLGSIWATVIDQFYVMRIVLYKGIGQDPAYKGFHAPCSLLVD